MRASNGNTLMASAAIICAVTVATPAAAQAKNYEVPAQSAQSAISALGRQADIQIIAARRITAGKRTNAVRGSMTVEQALDALLRGTGLTARRTGAQTYTIVASAVGGPSAYAAETAPTQVAALEKDVARDMNEDIIVTAQKRVEKIQDVPAAISAVSGRRLEQLGATQLVDYAAYVPGLIVDTGGTPGQTQITIRGLSPINSTAMVATYIDDSPLGSSAGWVGANQFSLDLMPYDIERVEVLRGPQGTLYGANAMGGLLKYVTRTPDPNRVSGRMGAEISTIEGAADPGWGLRGSVNLPIVEGELAVTASFFTQFTPGFIDNGLTGEKDENAVEQKGARIALLWKMTDDVTVRLSAMGQNIDADGVAVVSLLPDSHTPIYGDLTSSHALDQRFNARMRYYTGSLNWSLGWADFVSATSYARTTTQDTSDSSLFNGGLYPIVSAALPEYSGGVIIPAGLMASYFRSTVNKLTQEFRLSSPDGGRLDWLIGSYYTDEDAFMLQRLDAYDSNKVLIPGPFNPFGRAEFPTRYRETAVFANVTYKLTDAFDISLGGRYSSNKQDFRKDAGGPGYILFGLAGHEVSGSKEDVFTYSIAPRWHVTEDTMVYARIASGYRPGGPNFAQPGIPPQVDSDRIVNYEIGLKSEFLDRRAMLDVAVFRVDWEDIQAYGFKNGISYQVNGGKARSQGVEFSAAFQPVRNLQFGFNTAYTDAELIDAIPSVGGMPGDQLAYTPRWSSAATADWQFELGGGWTGQVGGGIRNMGKRQVGFPAGGSSFGELAAYTALDLHGGISNDRWSLRFFARNLTDKRAYLVPTNMPGQRDAKVLQPRTVGLALEAKF
jgi:iron complex outermembrane receptor protein